MAQSPSLSQASISLCSSSLAASPSTPASQNHPSLCPLTCGSTGGTGQVSTWSCEPAKWSCWSGCCQEAGEVRQTSDWSCLPLVPCRLWSAGGMRVCCVGYRALLGLHKPVAIRPPTLQGPRGTWCYPPVCGCRQPEHWASGLVPPSTSNAGGAAGTAVSPCGLSPARRAFAGKAQPWHWALL